MDVPAAPSIMTIRAASASRKSSIRCEMLFMLQKRGHAARPSSLSERGPIGNLGGANGCRVILGSKTTHYRGSTSVGIYVLSAVTDRKVPQRILDCRSRSQGVKG